MEGTRVFVSGLPPSLSSDGLRKHFSKQFEVNDAHVISNRRIGFVGFKTQSAAENAVDYFNRTFISMSKISVEMARPAIVKADDVEGFMRTRTDQKFKVDAENDTSLQTKYKRHLNSNSNSIPLKRKRDTKEAEDDPKLQEYLTAMQPPTKTRTWADSATGTLASESKASKPSNGLDNVDDAASTEPDLKKHMSEETVAGGISDKELKSDRALDLNESVDAEANTAESLEEQEAPKSDADWLRSKTSRLLGLVDDDDDVNAVQTRTAEPSKDSADNGADRETKQVGNHDKLTATEARAPTPEETPDANIETIQQTGRLFIRNLPYNATEEDLRNAFSTFGKIDEVHVATDTRHATSKGFAYVQYVESESAVEAYKQLDGKDFQGRLIHILPASTKKTYKLDEYEISKLPLKKQQQIKRKAEATSSTFSWNSLYMNTDAVMASVAERLGVPKSQLLDPTSSDAAVKQAHAETHVIQETKAYFSANGVNIESFKQRERGNTGILLKNFTYGIKAEDLRKLCEPFGQIIRLLMPPSGTIAIVEFAMPGDAQKAFKGLAYKRLGDSILYAEKAPKNLFEGAPATTPSVTPQEEKAISQGFSTSDTFRADEPESHIESATLFVRNLNFSTTDAGLADLFKPLDGFISAKVKTKPDPKKPGERLSMGFGFVEFRNRAQAEAALKSLNGYKLDQHELVIKPSHKGQDAAEQQRREDTSKKAAARKTKIIIKNLPFQATKKDIWSLFAAYGKLRSVRVPKKFDRTARGFAFADFVSAREAENAMDALRNTHLLGRRLVLEFVSEEAIDPEEEIQKIEKKVGAQVNKVNIQKMMGSGRKKFNVDANLDDE